MQRFKRHPPSLAVGVGEKMTRVMCDNGSNGVGLQEALVDLPGCLPPHLAQILPNYPGPMRPLPSAFLWSRSCLDITLPQRTLSASTETMAGIHRPATQSLLQVGANPGVQDVLPTSPPRTASPHCYFHRLPLLLHLGTIWTRF